VVRSLNLLPSAQFLVLYSDVRPASRRPKLISPPRTVSTLTGLYIHIWELISVLIFSF
jgi:hypothetical protein